MDYSQNCPCSRISTPLVVESGPVVVNSQRWIELLARKQGIVRGCAAGGQQVAEGIIVVLVGSFASVESS